MRRNVWWLCAAALVGGGCSLVVERSVSPGELRGVVEGERDVDGKRVGLEGARVQVVGTPFVVRTDPNGKFVVRRLPGGNHEVTIQRDGDGDGKNESQLRLRDIAMPKLASGARNAYDLGRMLLEPSGAVSGRITNATGTVAIGVRGRPGVVVPSTVDGRFELPFLAGGTIELVALVPGVDGTTSVSLGSVDVVPRQTKSVSYALADNTAQAIVNGRFIYDDGLAPSFDLLAAELIGATSARPLVIDPQAGTFSEAVPPGVYTLHLLPQNGVAELFVPGVAAFGDVQVSPVYVFDTTQGFDLDQDGIDDAEDPDMDGDGTPNANEAAACVRDPYGTLDSDADGLCDTVDPDADADGLPLGLDNCARTANGDQSDSDGDGVGDACDNCRHVANPGQDGPDGEETGLACNADSDGDRIPDRFDNCPHLPNPNQEDLDHDGIGDVCDDGGSGPVDTGWTTLVDTPGRRHLQASVWDASRNTVWVYGGMDLNERNGAGDLWRLDLAAPGWKAAIGPGGVPNLQFPSMFHDADDDTLVVVGGQQQGLQFDPVIATFDIGASGWRVIWPSGNEPVPHWSGDEVESTYDATTNTVRLVDLRANGAASVYELAIDGLAGWVEHATTAGQSGKPNGLHGSVMSRANGEIVVVGSLDGATEVWRITPGTWVWQRDPAPQGEEQQPPVGRAWPGVASDGTTAYLVGGQEGDAYWDDAWTLELATGKWTWLGRPLLEQMRYGSAVALTDSLVVVIGGRDMDRQYGDVLTFPRDGLAGGTLIAEVPMPEARWNAAVAWDQSNDRLYVHGGAWGIGRSDDLWVYRFSEGDLWARADGAAIGAPSPREAASLVYVPDDNVLVMAGGRGGMSAPVDQFDVWTFDVQSGGWGEIFPTGNGPGAFSNAPAVWDAAGRRMLVFPRAGDRVFALDALEQVPTWTELTLDNPKSLADVEVVWVPGEGAVAYFGNETTPTLEKLVFTPSPHWETVPGSTNTGRPTQRANARIAVDPLTKRILVAGGGPSGSYSDDAFVFDYVGQRWNALCPQVPSLGLRRGSQIVGTFDGWLFFGNEFGVDVPALLSYDTPFCGH